MEEAALGARAVCAKTVSQSPGARVLIVDDDELTRGVLTRYLQKQGHAARSVESADKAVLLLRSEKFDVILLDHLLQDRQGLVMIPELRKRSQARIIMITGTRDLDLEHEARLLGAVCLMTKPLDLPDLDNRIRELTKP